MTTAAYNDLTAQQLSYSFAKKHQLVLGQCQDDHIEIFCVQVPTADILMEVRRYLAMPIVFCQVNRAEFNQRLTEVYETKNNTNAEILTSLEDEFDLAKLVDSIPEREDLLAAEDNAPIIKLLNSLFTQAIKQLASDIHFETYEENLRVRFRIDGVLHEVLDIQRNFAPFVMSRIKVMAKLDIAEKRLPQDGRISLTVAGRSIDVRVSTIPTNHGERAVLRLLDKDASRLELTKLGMNKQTLALMQKLIRQPHGIILVTGPTGSGKSTTLYAALSQLNTTDLNILTVEDPIEYDIAGIGQTQINPKIKMTFSKGLRAILRQDPDVVMVGEIRDSETVSIAVQASLTGHLVLSTLHTNTAIGAVTRMVDLGVEPFLLSSSVIGLLAQRLVRKLCQHCKTPQQASEDECKIMQIDSQKNVIIYQANGCEHCNGLGYRGRMGIYELIAIDDRIREMINKQSPEQEIESYARQYFPGIRHDGCEKILAGKTTIEEVLRVTSEG